MPIPLRSIDEFALAAMASLLSTENIDTKLKLRTITHGGTELDQLASAAYAIAVAMEAESVNH